MFIQRSEQRSDLRRPRRQFDLLLRPPTDLRGSTTVYASLTSSGIAVLGQPAKAACVVPVARDERIWQQISSEESMKNTRSEHVSNPASVKVYELKGRRFVVDTTYQNNNGLPLSQILLRCMVNDGKQPSEIHDAGR